MRRGVLGLVGAFLLLTACGGGDDDDAGDGRGGSDGGAQESSTTTAGGDGGESTTSTTPAEGPEEWIEVARELNQRHFELLAEPDLDRVHELYAPECQCRQQAETVVQRLIDQARHMEGQPANVLAVSVVDDHELQDPERPDQPVRFVTLMIKGMPNTLREVDEQGNVAEEHSAEGIAPGCSRVTFRFQPDGSYQVTEYADSECPDGL